MYCKLVNTDSSHKHLYLTSSRQSVVSRSVKYFLLVVSPSSQYSLLVVSPSVQYLLLVVSPAVQYLLLVVSPAVQHLVYLPCSFFLLDLFVTRHRIFIENNQVIFSETLYVRVHSDGEIASSKQSLNLIADQPLILPDEAGLCEVLGLLPAEVPMILAVPIRFMAEVGRSDVPGL